MVEGGTIDLLLGAVHTNIVFVLVIFKKLFRLMLDAITQDLGYILRLIHMNYLKALLTLIVLTRRFGIRGRTCYVFAL